MSIPYIQVKGPDVCYGSTGDPDQASFGYHAFFVTYVPFIPSFLSDDFTRMITGEASRIKLIVNRQIRFLNDLSSCKTGASETFDLRFVSIPQIGQPFNTLRIFFIGKAFHEEETVARNRALVLWKKFQGFFPLEDPFNYPLQTITAIRDENGQEVCSQPEMMQLALRPLRFEATHKPKIVEIHKYEDYDPMLGNAAEANSERFVGYYPHPFRPTLDFSAMSRFLETFALQTQKCVVSICLRPTKLSLAEQQHINRMMQFYRQLLSGAEEAQNWLAFYRRERFNDLVQTFEPIINQRNHLFMIKIQIMGEESIPHDVVSALGSEIMNNSTREPRLWDEIQPENDEGAAIVGKNFDLMEYRPWKRPDTSFPLWRLSTLVTSYEAVGAFRLPVPPESGHMPGISVRDEPFVMPADLDTPQKSKIRNDIHVPLGKIIHRGTITETDYYISLSQLKRHGLVAGSTGSGKTNTCLHLLTEMWRKFGIPFLVIYPIDKPDYRLLKADPTVRDDLFLFTLGDDTTSPLRFNPFEVPPGILVRTHISLLMRAFTAAFSMWDPLPAVYRAALRKAYQEVGFADLRSAKGGDANTSAPLLSRFYELLVETAEQMTQEYGRDARGNIRQGSEIRIRDLLNNAGHVLNVQRGAPWNVLLNHPTVMEIGRVGSTEDSSLVMGFLLMSLTSYLASRYKHDENARQHITLIEEAHRLMSAKSSGQGEAMADPRSRASEDFANILAEVRGYNESILIAEQIPTELVSGAIGNTYVKIVHWLEEQRSFDLFSDIMSLNKQQREFARTLPTGQAIVRGANGRPMLIQVSNYLDQFQRPDDTPLVDDSDEAIRVFMEKQLKLHRLQIPLFEPITEVSNNLSEKKPSWMLQLPMQSCAMCVRLHESGKCSYGKDVRGELVMHSEELLSQCDNHYEAIVLAKDVKVIITNLDTLQVAMKDYLLKHKPTFTNYHQKGIVYCYLAHRANETFQQALGKDAEEKGKRKNAHQALLFASQTVVDAANRPSMQD